MGQDVVTKHWLIKQRVNSAHVFHSLLLAAVRRRVGGQPHFAVVLVDGTINEARGQKNSLPLTLSVLYTDHRPCACAYSSRSPFCSEAAGAVVVEPPHNTIRAVAKQIGVYLVQPYSNPGLEGAGLHYHQILDSELLTRRRHQGR